MEHTHVAGCGCQHDADGESFSLYRHIHVDGVSALNEAVEGSVIKVFKPEDKKLNRSEWIDSDADETLIIHIPFTGQVKLKSIVIIGGDGGASPKHMKVWKNREDIDFDNVDDVTPTQSFDLLEDATGELEWPTQFVNFQDVRMITLYIESNFGADETRIYYIGLKGEYSDFVRKPIEVMYEAAAMPEDHKAEADYGVGAPAAF